MIDWQTPLSAHQVRLVSAAREKCRVLYEGVLTPHRSCGIALAETFGLATPAYQALRKGGVTGTGSCGSIVAGRLVLGELLGDPDPTGPVTDALRGAAGDYDRLWPERISWGAASRQSHVCDDLVGQFDDFMGPARAGFCASLASRVAELVAEVALRHGHPLHVAPIAGLDWEPSGGWPA